jgi:hypothetical protein
MDLVMLLFRDIVHHARCFFGAFFSGGPPFRPPARNTFSTLRPAASTMMKRTMYSRKKTFKILTPLLQHSGDDTRPKSPEERIRAISLRLVRKKHGRIGATIIPAGELYNPGAMSPY